MAVLEKDALEEAHDVVTKVAAKAIKDGGKATFAQLMNKPRRTLTFTVYSTDDSGEEVALQIKYKALSSKVYDDLLAAHPPSAKEKHEGANYNVDTFTAALIAAVSVEPALDYEQASELFHSSDWASGEISSLFINALRVCNAGLDVPFNARD